METTNQYYIQNRAAGFLGNAIMFWARGNRGYTASLENAEKYNYDDAKKICEGNPEKNRAWPCEYIDNNKGTTKHTDYQYLDTENAVNFK